MHGQTDFEHWISSYKCRIRFVQLRYIADGFVLIFSVISHFQVHAPKDSGQIASSFPYSFFLPIKRCLCLWSVDLLRCFLTNLSFLQNLLSLENIFFLIFKRKTENSCFEVLDMNNFCFQNSFLSLLSSKALDANMLPPLLSQAHRSQWNSVQRPCSLIQKIAKRRNFLSNHF